MSQLTQHPPVQGSQRDPTPPESQQPQTELSEQTPQQGQPGESRIAYPLIDPIPELWRVPVPIEPSKLPRATLQQKVRVLDWFHLHSSKSQRAVVKYFQSLNEFCIAKSSFSRWVQDESVIRSDYAKLRSYDKGSVRTRASIKFPEVEYSMSKFYEQALYEFGPNYKINGIAGVQLVSKWFYFAKIIHPTIDFATIKKGPGWLQHFKFKHRERSDLIVEFKEKIEPVINSTRTVEDEKKRIKDVISNYKPSDVFHFDEFQVSTKILPSDHSPQLKFIVGFGVNANNTEWLPLLKVSTSTVNSLRLDPHHYQSNTGLMTDEIFEHYLSELDRSIENSFAPNRKILILLDTLYEHIVPKYSHIDICYFNSKYQTFFSNLDQHDPFSTTLKAKSECEIQPLNLGIIKNFKLEFKLTLLKHHLSYVETKKAQVLKPINMQLVSELIEDTFKSIKSSDLNKHILKCWEISELLPWTPIKKNAVEQFNLVFRTETEFNFWKIIGILQGKGVLNFANQNVGVGAFNLDQILFPLDEYVVNKHYSDHEIIAMVKAQVQDRTYGIEDENAPAEDDSIDKLDRQTLVQINKLLNVDLLNFFNSHLSSFPESNKTFNSFMNSFIKESMGIYLGDKVRERQIEEQNNPYTDPEDEDEDIEDEDAEQETN